MTNCIPVRLTLRLSGLLCALGALLFAHSAAAQLSCTVTVKNCAASYDGPVSARAYNGVDESHTFAATETGTMAWGESKQLSCNWVNCDILFSVKYNVGNRLQSYDACDDVTLQRLYPGDDPGNLRVDKGINVCFHDSEGNER